VLDSLENYISATRRQHQRCGYVVDASKHISKHSILKKQLGLSLNRQRRTDVAGNPAGMGFRHAFLPALTCHYERCFIDLLWFRRE